MTILNFIDRLNTNPKRVFLIDALGALLTAIILFGVLAQLEHYFGMPSKVLYQLSATALCLFIYSLSCHLLIKVNWEPFLRIIIGCNVAYAVISIGLIINYSERITGLGFTYFILELIVIGLIVFVEHKTYSTQSSFKNEQIKP